jgi:hypothetical protein
MLNEENEARLFTENIFGVALGDITWGILKNL